MGKFLIIPDRNDIDTSLSVADKYGFGFEYNDFFIPDVMDNKKLVEELVLRYKAHELPETCTMHGAFFDVLISAATAGYAEYQRSV